MAYLHFGNNVFKFGNSLLNSGESFTLKTIGSTFPGGGATSCTINMIFSTAEKVMVNFGDGDISELTAVFVSTGRYQLTFQKTLDNLNNINVHTYLDGNTNGMRSITFSFDRSKLLELTITNVRLQVADFLFEFVKYPNFKLISFVNEPYLLNLNVESIPGSSVTSLGIGSAFNASSRLYKTLPIEIFSAPLQSLSCGTPGFTGNFSQTNIDKMYLLASTLKSLQLVGIPITDNYFGDGALPSTFNQLVNLNTITLQTTNHTTTPPVLNEIVSLASLGIIFNASYSSYGNIPALVNIHTMIFTANGLQPDTLPSYFNNFTKLKSYQAAGCFLTQTRVDTFINSFYTLTVSNASMTSPNTLPFRGMFFNIGSFGSLVAGTPSGVYQQPSGFVLGSNNGSPATPKEKLWVMVNQYGHSWLTV